jgi:hypothetical protein
MQVTAMHRAKLHHEGRVSYGVLASARSGAIVWWQPLSASHHQLLSALSKAMYTGVTHIAGLNPCSFRSPRLQGHMAPGDQTFGVPPAVDGVLDGELMGNFLGLSRATQEQLAQQAGVQVTDVVLALHEASSAAAIF